MKFDQSILSGDDLSFANSVLGPSGLYGREPDLIIAPDGNPYLFRWFVVPHNHKANVYLHVQISSDPERPLHDHPWDNTSVIISGGYDELWCPQPWTRDHYEDDQHYTRRSIRKGDVVHRAASDAHRLLLPKGIPYTMSMFSTGPKMRSWGFWYPEGWREFAKVTTYDAATHVSTHTRGKQ